MYQAKPTELITVPISSQMRGGADFLDYSQTFCQWKQTKWYKKWQTAFSQPAPNTFYPPSTLKYKQDNTLNLAALITHPVSVLLPSDTAAV